MPPVPDVRFHSPIDATGRMPHRLQFRQPGRRRRRSIVAGRNNQRVFQKPFSFQGLHDLPDAVIGLHDEIRVCIDATPTFPILSRHHGTVRGIPGNVHEKRLVVRLTLDKLDRLPGQQRQHLNGLNLALDNIVFDPKIHLPGMMEAIKLIESAIVQWAVSHLGPDIHGILFGILNSIEFYAQMPLPNRHRPIASCFGHLCQCQCLFGDQGIAPG